MMMMSSNQKLNFENYAFRNDSSVYNYATRLESSSGSSEQTKSKFNPNFLLRKSVYDMDSSFHSYDADTRYMFYNGATIGGSSTPPPLLSTSFNFKCSRIQQASIESSKYQTNV